MANTITIGRRTITIVPSAGVDIGGITKAAAAVVTWSAHGLITGDYVSFSGITQTDWTILNGNSYPITWVSANTFSIPVDTHSIAVAYNTSDPGTIGSDFDIARVQSDMVQVGTVAGNFTVGETVTQATSGTTGIVFRWDTVSKILYLVSVTGVFDTTHTVTGGSSGATGIPLGPPLAFPDGIRLTGVSFKGLPGDHLIMRSDKAVGAPVFNRTDHHGSGVSESMSGKPLRCKPYITAYDCAFADVTQVSITLEYD